MSEVEREFGVLDVVEFFRAFRSSKCPGIFGQAFIFAPLHIIFESHSGRASSEIAGNIGFPSPDPRMVLEVLSLETAQPEPGT